MFGASTGRPVRAAAVRIVAGGILLLLAAISLLNGIRDHAITAYVAEVHKCARDDGCSEADLRTRISSVLAAFPNLGFQRSNMAYLAGLRDELDLAPQDGSIRDRSEQMRLARQSYLSAAVHAVGNGSYWLAVLRKSLLLGDLKQAEHSLGVLMSVAPYELHIQREFVDLAFRYWPYWSEDVQRRVRDNVRSSLAATPWGDEYIVMAFKYRRGELVKDLVANEHQRSVYQAHLGR